MTEDSGQSGPSESCAKREPTIHAGDSLSSQRVYKKSSPNNKLTLYLSSRDLVVSSGRIDRLQGVLLVDPEFVEERKVYGQVTLTFRYGREDEEVMGLKFCNEAVMCLAQLYPPHPAATQPEGITPLQEALVRRLGPNAHPFSMEITPLAPPSVQLVPAKEYNGAPIGTSYDVRAYIAEKSDEKLHRRTTVRMGIRVVQRVAAPPSPQLYNPSRNIRGTKLRNHKTSLFGCKSAPLESKLSADLPNQNMSRSVEADLEKSKSNHAIKLENNVDRTNFTDDKISGEKSKNQHKSKIERNYKDDQSEADSNRIKGGLEEEEHNQTNKCMKNIINESKIGTHVSFKVELTNGTEIPSDKINADNTNRNSPMNDTADENESESPIKQLTVESTEIEAFADEKKLFQTTCSGKRPSLAAFLAEVPPPHASVEKPFILSDGRIELEASLDKGIYSHGEEVLVHVQVRNTSNKTVRRIKVFIVQHVDVCMFSNGKFKNVVATVNSKPDGPVGSGSSLTKTYTLIPTKSSTKNWIALEDSYTKTGASLASTVTSCINHPDERNVFAIYVTYYVKIKLVVSVMGGELSLKLPFTLMHTCSEFDPAGTLTREIETPQVQLNLKSTAEDVKPDKDGT